MKVVFLLTDICKKCPVWLAVDFLHHVLQLYPFVSRKLYTSVLLHL